MEIRLKKTDPSDPDYVALVSKLDAELRLRDGDEHVFYASYNKSDSIKHVVLAYVGEQPVGCGAIKFYEEGIAELKRMYVLPEYRSKGIAGWVLKALEIWAMELNFKELILETGIAMPEAIALYKKHGYTSIPNYGQYANKTLSVCMHKIIVHTNA